MSVNNNVDKNTPEKELKEMKGAVCERGSSQISMQCHFVISGHKRL